MRRELSASDAENRFAHALRRAEVRVVGRLVGYRRTEGFSRAFQRWSGPRPRVYRELGGSGRRDGAAAWDRVRALRGPSGGGKTVAGGRRPGADS